TCRGPRSAAGYAVTSWLFLGAESAARRGGVTGVRGRGGTERRREHSGTAAGTRRGGRPSPAACKAGAGARRRRVVRLERGEAAPPRPCRGRAAGRRTRARILAGIVARPSVGTAAGCGGAHSIAGQRAWPERPAWRGGASTGGAAAVQHCVEPQVAFEKLDEGC
ncbi:unnamed protein product, partial [Phaeothamnion confervicola]